MVILCHLVSFLLIGCYGMAVSEFCNHPPPAPADRYLGCFHCYKKCLSDYLANNVHPLLCPSFYTQEEQFCHYLNDDSFRLGHRNTTRLAI